MGDLPKTVRYGALPLGVGHPMRTIGGIQAVDELLARIAELEADVLRSDKAVEDAAVALEVCDTMLATEREHPTSILQCAACQRLAVVQNVQLAARAELAEADLAWFKSRHTAAGCGMDATTGSLHVTTTGAYCVSDVPNSFDHGEE